MRTLLWLLLVCLLGRSEGLGEQTCYSSEDCQYEECANSYCPLVDDGYGGFSGFCTRDVDSVPVRCPFKKCPPGSRLYQDGPGAYYCFECSRGAYTSAPTYATACGLCAAGTYQTGIMSSGCVECAAGQYQSGSGMMRATDCQACQAGKYGSVAGLSACPECGPGTYQDEAGGTTACKLCPAGRMRATPGAVALANCAECNRGKYTSADGQSVCTDCQPGSYQQSARSTACVACEPGSYQSRQANTQGCDWCTAGKYASAQGQAECQSCAPGGYQTGSQGAGCVACGLGQYQTGLGATAACPLCQPGKYTARPGEPGCSSCGPGEYQTGLEMSGCSVCASGTFSTAIAAATGEACVACAAGKYIVGNGCAGCTARPGPEWFALAGCSLFGDARWQRCAAACPAGAVQRAACTNVSDLECWWPDGDARCTGVPTNMAGGVPEWLPAGLRCPRGQYLHGFRSLTDKDCRLCPEDTVSLNGVSCEACAGQLEEPYWLDHSLCVCRPPAVLVGGAGCVCPAGWSLQQLNGSSGCVPCAAGSQFGAGPGRGCEACGPGTYSVAAAATSCEVCASGMFRLAGSPGGCERCPLDGWYAPDATQAGCVACDASCAGRPGWTDGGACPGNAEGWRVCVPCSLPGNATWREGCVYECDAGFYRKDGGCHACSTGACEAGRRWEACSADADRRCDAECVNASKPLLNARWAASAGRDCPWECEPGFALVRTDYWVFALEECVAAGLEEQSVYY